MCYKSMSLLMMSRRRLWSSSDGSDAACFAVDLSHIRQIDLVSLRIDNESEFAIILMTVRCFDPSSFRLFRQKQYTY